MNRKTSLQWTNLNRSWALPGIIRWERHSLRHKGMVASSYFQTIKVAKIKFCETITSIYQRINRNILMKVFHKTICMKRMNKLEMAWHQTWFKDNRHSHWTIIIRDKNWLYLQSWMTRTVLQITSHLVSLPKIRNNYKINSSLAKLLMLSPTWLAEHNITCKILVPATINILVLNQLKPFQPPIMLTVLESQLR